MVGLYSPGMRSPFDHPKAGHQVLVWLELRDNPPALNAPGKFSLGHWVGGGDHWPEDGWFFRGPDAPGKFSFGHWAGGGDNPHWPEDSWFFRGPDYWRVAGWWPLPEEPHRAA